MRLSSIAALTASLATGSSQILKGFNYGSTETDGVTPITNYAQLFAAAQNVVGTSGFSSARLYTMIQAGTAGSSNTPTAAIQAAIDTNTKLLLGLWASAGSGGIDQEISAFRQAVTAHGTRFTDLIVAISVGSEDLYRISPTGIINKSGGGAEPYELVNYISTVKNYVNQTPELKGKLVGHVDTWTAWVNGSNDAVISAVDFIGTDAYPYFQTTMPNSIDDGAKLFKSAYQDTVNVAQGKPVWVTETGWPVSGKTAGLAVPNPANAKTYWDRVGCEFLFDKINTFWYTLQDDVPFTPNPSFGILNAELSTTPLYDLSCSGVSSSSSSRPESSTEIPVPAASAVPVGNAGAAMEASAVNKGGEGSEKATPAPVAAGAGGKSTVDMTVYTTVTTCPVTSTIGTETHTYMTTSVVTVTSCAGGCPTTPAAAAEAPSTGVTKTSALPAAAAESTGCPAKLTAGSYEFPHLIVPIHKDEPTKAHGTSYNGTFSSSISSLFNFDIPASDAGKTCTLVFLLPEHSQLVTSSYSLSGTGGLDVTLLKSLATEHTTYDSIPAVDKNLSGPATVTPGSEYVIASGSCPAGKTISYEVSATGSLALNYFQDFNPSAIGLYITVC